ncbi:MAG TPA: aspartate 1-decarboxylase [Actinoplanes sp.]|nr:aspartate 1-decarboxylase [Actinoplanes sp.]
MQLTLLKGKIHRATVTQCDLHYVGSLTIDADLMDAADLLPGELIHVLNINNGNRLETYVLEGRRGTGIVGINGAAARLVQRGDLIIIAGYATVDDATARAMKPRVIFVDGGNNIVDEGLALAGVPEGFGLLPGDLEAAR